MKYLMRNAKQIICCALCFFFGSILTLNFMQIDLNNYCIEDKLREENYKFYKVSKWENPTLIILIISSPVHFEHRNTIRNTWLLLDQRNRNDAKMKHFFVLGSIGLSTDTMLHLSTEQSRYNDLIFLPLNDQYTTLSNKVLQSYVWLHEQIRYGLNFSYVLKCDDDSFIRIDTLKDELKLFTNKSINLNKLNNSVMSINMQLNDESLLMNNNLNVRYLYWGYFNGNAKIKIQGKWMENDWILCDHYLPYALGGGYVLSRGLVDILAKNANDLKLYKSEDVSVGTWLASIANIIRIHDIRFNTEWTSRGCLNSYLVYHKISIDEMKTMYKNIETDGKPCLNEQIKRKHYLYNWNVLPSKCCTR